MADHSRYAIIDANGLVINTVTIGDQTTKLVSDFDGAGEIGDTWDGTKFVKPAAASTPTTAPAEGQPVNVIE